MTATITMQPAPAPAAIALLNRTVNIDDIPLRYADFESMYRREYPAMFSVASALSGADGEDLVHDAMVRALLNWNRVQRLERPGGWCHRVLINLCRSRWRRNRTAANYLARQRRHEPSTPEPSAEAFAFWVAVRELPVRQRTVVALYYAGDHPTAEIALILDVPAGTVRSDLTRARQWLATELGV